MAGPFLGEGTLSAQRLYMFSVHNRPFFTQEIMGNCARGWGYKTDSAIRWLYSHAPFLTPSVTSRLLTMTYRTLRFSNERKEGQMLSHVSTLRSPIVTTPSP